jgi:hypothetical protein
MCKKHTTFRERSENTDLAVSGACRQGPCAAFRGGVSPAAGLPALAGRPPPQPPAQLPRLHGKPPGGLRQQLVCGTGSAWQRGSPASCSAGVPSAADQPRSYHASCEQPTAPPCPPPGPHSAHTAVNIAGGGVPAALEGVQARWRDSVQVGLPRRRRRCCCCVVRAARHASLRGGTARCSCPWPCNTGATTDALPSAGGGRPWSHCHPGVCAQRTACCCWPHTRQALGRHTPAARPCRLQRHPNPPGRHEHSLRHCERQGPGH